MFRRFPLALQLFQVCAFFGASIRAEEPATGDAKAPKATPKRDAEKQPAKEKRGWLLGR